MIVQFYTMQTPEEALAVIEAGADHIGLTPSARGLPGEIDMPTTQAIMQATVGKAPCRPLWRWSRRSGLTYCTCAP
jgi:phosphoribosylanthranilate isomerase